MNNWAKYLMILLVIALGWLSSQQIDLTNSDLGRHLINGREAWKTGVVFLTNEFSYTYPNYPFVNHHWGSGVIFYLVHRMFGFGGLSVLLVIVNLAIAGIVIDLIRRYGKWEWGLISGIIFLPLIVYRAEIRPEIFSSLLWVVFLWVLWRWRNGEIGNKWLLILVGLQWLWVNLHIYFIFGWMMIGLFWLDTMIRWKTVKAKMRWWISSVLVAGILVCLYNPMGLNGLIEPFKINTDRGYRVLEEQTVWFVQQIIPLPVLPYFYLAVGLFVIGWLLRLLQPKDGVKRWSLWQIMISVVILILSFVMIRNFTIFGWIGWVLTAISLSWWQLPSFSKENRMYFWGSLLGLSLLTVLILNNNYWMSKQRIGLGLIANNEASAEFYIKNELSGPIFNNYDIGSYLTYTLYPKEKVFVDNRPEAYPAEWFRNIYIPMQENNSVWQEQLTKYDFNVIFFNRLDLTPWAQQFLGERIKDEEWVPVFVDDQTIIFVRRAAINLPVIYQYGLPKEMFNVK